MTSVLQGHRHLEPSVSTSESGQGTGRGRRLQRPGTALAGVGLVALGAVISGSLVVRARSTTQVLVLARPVAAGSTLTSADLSQASISGSGLTAVAASAAASVVGRQVSVGLPAGTLLTAGMLGSSSGIASGEAAVAVVVKPGLVPAGLVAGDRVAVISAHSTGATGTVLVADAPVTAVTVDPQTGDTTLTVLVGQSSVATVAAASANGTAVPVTVSGSR